MRAMLLTAGLGRRMYPLTLTRPKPVIPVLGRPLVVQVLRWLGARGMDEVVLNLHHFPEVVERVIGSGLNVGLPEVQYSFEEVILGTAGGIRHAAPLLGSGESILVSNSDFLSDIDMEAAEAQHLRSGFAATLILTTWRRGYSRVEVDADGRVLSLAGKPEADPGRVADEQLFTGCSFLEEEILERIPAEGPSDLREIYRQLAAEGRLGSYFHDGFWWEFGSPELLLNGSLKLLGMPAGELKQISCEHDPVRGIGDGVAAVGPGVEIDDSVCFRGAASLGYSSFVSKQVTIEDSVIMPEAWIGPDCRLRRTIVDQGVELPAGFDAEGVVICNDPDPEALLSASTRRINGLLLHALGAPSPE